MRQITFMIQKKKNIDFFNKNFKSKEKKKNCVKIDEKKILRKLKKKNEKKKNFQQLNSFESTIIYKKNKR